MRVPSLNSIVALPFRGSPRNRRRRGSRSTATPDDAVAASSPCTSRRPACFTPEKVHVPELPSGPPHPLMLIRASWLARGGCSPRAGGADRRPDRVVALPRQPDEAVAVQPTLVVVHGTRSRGRARARGRNRCARRSSSWRRPPPAPATAWCNRSSGDSDELDLISEMSLRLGGARLFAAGAPPPGTPAVGPAAMLPTRRGVFNVGRRCARDRHSARTWEQERGAGDASSAPRPLRELVDELTVTRLGLWLGGRRRSRRAQPVERLVEGDRTKQDHQGGASDQRRHVVVRRLMTAGRTTARPGSSP